MPLVTDTPQAVPEEIRGWNWGAFFMTWLWGLFNGSYLALLTFIPVVSWVMPFVLGAKGNEWAWKNKTWESVEQFKRVQRAWSIAGWASLAFCFVVFGIIGGIVFNVLYDNDVVRATMVELKHNKEATSLLGEPIKKGLFVSGNYELKNSVGTADLSVPVEGPKAKGTVHVVANKKDGVWIINTLNLTVDGHEQAPIELENSGNVLKI